MKIQKATRKREISCATPAFCMCFLYSKKPMIPSFFPKPIKSDFLFFERIKDLELGDRPTSQCHHREPSLASRRTPFETVDQCPLAHGIVEFKNFIHCEILSLKVQISRCSKSDAGRSLIPQPPRSPRL